MQQLQEADVVKRVKYCMWLLNSFCAGLLDPFQYIMSEKVWFHLSGHVNSQNTLYWAAENPHLVHSGVPRGGVGGVQHPPRNSEDIGGVLDRMSK